MRVPIYFITDNNATERSDGPSLNQVLGGGPPAARIHHAFHPRRKSLRAVLTWQIIHYCFRGGGLTLGASNSGTAPRTHLINSRIPSRDRARQWPREIAFIIHPDVLWPEGSASILMNANAILIIGGMHKIDSLHHRSAFFHKLLFFGIPTLSFLRISPSL